MRWVGIRREMKEHEDDKDDDNVGMEFLLLLYITANSRLQVPFQFFCSNAM